MDKGKQRRRWTGTRQIPVASFDDDQFHCCCGAVTSTFPMCMHKVGPEMCRCHCWFMLSHIFTSVFVSFFVVAVTCNIPIPLHHARHPSFVWLARALAPARINISLSSFENKCCKCRMQCLVTSPRILYQTQIVGFLCAHNAIYYLMWTRLSAVATIKCIIISKFILHFHYMPCVHPDCLVQPNRAQCVCERHSVYAMCKCLIRFSFFFSLLSFIFASLSTDFNWMCVASGREIQTEEKELKRTKSFEW